MSRKQLKEKIDSSIVTNGQGKITAVVMNDVLNSMTSTTPGEIIPEGGEIFNLYEDTSKGLKKNIATGPWAHAEGAMTTASEAASHAEGGMTTASGLFSHAEGGPSSPSGNLGSEASGFGAHAEGGMTTASGDFSHAEGAETTASGHQSHAEGFSTTASGNSSHAEGSIAIASGRCSHAEGDETTADNYAQHTQGRYNVQDLNPTTTDLGDTTINSIKPSFVVGNGSPNAKHDSLRLLNNGKLYLQDVGGFKGNEDYAAFESAITGETPTIKSVQEVISEGSSVDPQADSSDFNYTKVTTIPSISTQFKIVASESNYMAEVCQSLYEIGLIASPLGITQEEYDSNYMCYGRVVLSGGNYRGFHYVGNDDKYLLENKLAEDGYGNKSYYTYNTASKSWISLYTYSTASSTLSTEILFIGGKGNGLVSTPSIIKIDEYNDIKKAQPLYNASDSPYLAECCQKLYDMGIISSPEYINRLESEKYHIFYSATTPLDSSHSIILDRQIKANLVKEGWDFSNVTTNEFRVISYRKDKIIYPNIFKWYDLPVNVNESESPTKTEELLYVGMGMYNDYYDNGIHHNNLIKETNTYHEAYKVMNHDILFS